MLILPDRTRLSSKEPTPMSSLQRAASTVLAVGAGLLLAAACYTEAHRAPDQP
jgi:hypothetical protein